MSRLLGKYALVEILRSEGIRHIFGNPGTSESSIMHALESAPDLEYILAAQEGTALGMADCYARVTGRPTFVNLHVETGLANGLSLLFDAYRGGTPLVLSSGNSDVRKLAEGRTDLAGFASPFTKWSAEVTHPEQLASVMRRAFTEAKTPPTGPVYVGFAPNALDEEAEIDIRPSADVYSRISPDPRALDEAVALLADAQRPTILLGDRVAEYDAVEAAVSVAEKLGARVYGNSYGAMIYPTNHPLWAGLVAPYMRFIRKALAPADVVLAVGTQAFHSFFDPLQGVLNDSAHLIHIDINPGEIGQSQPTAVGMLADPKTALTQLSDALSRSMSEPQNAAARARAHTLAREHAAPRHALEGLLAEAGDQRPMLPERLMSEVAAVLPPDAIVIDDSVTGRFALHQATYFTRPGSVFAERAGGAIGWGMGATLGAKLASPDRPVVGLIGDGSAMMTVQALWTAAAYQIPAVYVICNNQTYRVLKVNMRQYFADVLGQPDLPTKYIGMDFPRPFDLAAIAEAMGMSGQRIEDPTAVGPALQRALESGRPALLDVIIDGSL